MENSNVKITKVCDICNRQVPNLRYVDIIKARKAGDNLDRCEECGHLKKGETRKVSPFKKSLVYLFPNIAKTFHPSLNGKVTPDKIYAKSGEKYWWLCSDCNSSYDMIVCDRTIKGLNCPFCSNQRVNETNCIWKVKPEIAKLLKNTEEGYIYTVGSDAKTDWICPDCAEIIKNKRIADINRNGLSCPRCSDGISFPEKIMFNVLSQIGIDFEYQKIFEWSKS
jgi:rubrerythrin